ncbi:hypothetical protein [Idiomarina abyssalis]|uniref:hypothetical protein n=1 Tax=Idiomarina abyssalis TaxID=86102 RepID=UPI003A8E1BE5
MSAYRQPLLPVDHFVNVSTPIPSKSSSSSKRIEKSLVVQPSLDEAKSLFEDAKKHEVSIPTNIIKLYRYFEHTNHRKDESIIQAFGKTYVFKDGGRQRNPGTNRLIKIANTDKSGEIPGFFITSRIVENCPYLLSVKPAIAATVTNSHFKVSHL